MVVKTIIDLLSLDAIDNAVDVSTVPLDKKKYSPPLVRRVDNIYDEAGRDVRYQWDIYTKETVSGRDNAKAFYGIDHLKWVNLCFIERKHVTKMGPEFNYPNIKLKRFHMPMYLKPVMVLLESSGRRRLLDGHDTLILAAAANMDICISLWMEDDSAKHVAKTEKLSPKKIECPALVMNKHSHEKENVTIAVN